VGDENVTTRHLSLLLLVAGLVVLVVPSSASAFPQAPQPSCSPGPADCGAWHTTNVTVSWSHACGPTTITQDTGGTGVSCTATDAQGSVTSTVLVRKDSSPPGVTASADRGPDNNGWYNHGVSISFSGDDGTSGVAGCSSASYSGPDTGSVSVSGSCIDHAGNTGRGSIELKYDSTPPNVEAKPDRQPNPRGWYNREVTVAFHGSDATSGVDFCAPAVTYRGPDAPKTAVSGTCMDKAANTSPPAGFELSYDTRPPVLARVKAEITARGVLLKWKASKDTFSFDLVRRPGLKGKKPTTLYTGKALVFTDRRLTKGIKYRYTVTAYDEAENAAVKGLAVKPNVSVRGPAPKAKTTARPSLTRPAMGARVSAPPLLAWRAVPKATYYNVQLYHEGRKILTVWPSRPSFLVKRSWTYKGRTYRLAPGRYRWYVWPGLGPRSANRYGKLIGTRYFVVTRG
jgi:hypothetical protein